MSPSRDLEELVDLLVRAQEVSARAECTQIKVLIEIAMFELGRQIAQQSIRDNETIKTDPK